MTNKEVKNELIKKYRFLNENIEFILAPYMYEESEEEMLKRCEQYKSTINYPIIELQLEPIIYQLIEDFLFTSDKLENTLLYIIIEDLKTDDEYLLRVKEGLEILKKKNSNSNYLKENLDLNNIFHKLGRYIDEQSGDLENKQNKLLVLDEYFRELAFLKSSSFNPKPLNIPLPKYVSPYAKDFDKCFLYAFTYSSTE